MVKTLYCIECGCKVAEITSGSKLMDRCINMDLCKHCGFRGNLAKCSEAACNQHDNWFAQELIRLIDESSKFFSVHSFDGEKMEWLEKANKALQVT